jgi:hypothetical protein
LCTFFLSEKQFSKSKFDLNVSPRLEIRVTQGSNINKELILKNKHLLKINLEAEFLTEFNIYS